MEILLLKGLLVVITIIIIIDAATVTSENWK